ncbi:MAG: BrnT family toxin [Gammaproteobacteria bacterium]|nr:BrnT family toxin [Gammaproteobacteria bacterium]
MQFEWDATKEKENLRKHGISFAAAVECFFDPNGFALSDRLHSTVEKRFYWVGKSRAGRVLTTRYVKREQAIRVIGVAEWRKFREMYYERAKS